MKTILLVRHGLAPFFAFGAVVVFLCLAPSVWAQYQVFGWENFDRGQFPSTLVRSQHADDRTLDIGDLSAPGLSSEMRSGIAESECGRYCLRFSPNETQTLLSVTSTLALERDRLGAKGRAVFQADLWIPAQESDSRRIPNVSVVAMAPAQGASEAGWHFYRFGLTGGAEKVFFSAAVTGIQPKIYQHVALSKLTFVQRPGWHRFQIVFEGPENIYCAIDGNRVWEEPVVDGTLRRLQAGIMVAAVKDPTRPMYADNLSIQWTPEDAPPPDSPWVRGGSLAGRTLSSGGILAAPGPASGGAGLRWLTSPEEAWQECQATQKPILLLLYTPHARAWQSLEQMLATEPSASATLRNFVLMRLDANQLRGGSVAQKYLIYRFPSFVVVGVDGQARGNFTFGANDTWATAAARIEQAAGAAGAAR